MHFCNQYNTAEQQLFIVVHFDKTISSYYLLQCQHILRGIKPLEH